VQASVGALAGVSARQAFRASQELCLDVPKAQAVREALPGVEELAASAARFKALADPTRLAIGSPG